MSADWMAGFEEVLGCMGCGILLVGMAIGAVGCAFALYFAFH